MTIPQSLPIAISNDPNNVYYIQKNAQNNLKGLLWGAAGAVVISGVLTVTAGVAVGVTTAILASLGAVFNDSTRNTLGPGVPLVLFGAATVAFLNKKIVQATGACFKNAIYHLGPEYQIVALKKNV